MLRTRFALFSLLSLLIISCGDNATDLEVPVDYTFDRNGESTVDFSGQTTRIAMATELFETMSDFSGDYELLLEMYANQKADGSDADPYTDADLNASTKSIKSKVAASSDFFASNSVESAEIRADFEEFIAKHIAEIQPNQNILAAPSQAGQIADGSTPRYVNGKGLELNQAVAKSLIGALMVDQISNHYLSSTVLDAGNNLQENNNGIVTDGKSYTEMEHKWDEAYGYLFGASANPSDPLMSLGDDEFLNKYLSRVEEDSDFAGIANDIFEAFKTGRAAIVAGEYEIRDEQVEILREKIASIIAIRAVYYLQAAKTGIIANHLGTAFHDLSEGYGFIYSLRFTRDGQSDASIFSTSEVDGYLNQLLEGAGFWEVTPETLDEISEAIASRFEFTVSQAATI